MVEAEVKARPRWLLGGGSGAARMPWARNGRERGEFG